MPHLFEQNSCTIRPRCNIWRLAASHTLSINLKPPPPGARFLSTLPAQSFCAETQFRFVCFAGRRCFCHVVIRPVGDVTARLLTTL